MIDESAQATVAKIRAFAAAESSSRLLVLAVMCHGDTHDNMLFVERLFTADELIRELDAEREPPPDVSCCHNSNWVRCSPQTCGFYLMYFHALCNNIQIFAEKDKSAQCIISRK